MKILTRKDEFRFKEAGHVPGWKRLSAFFKCNHPPPHTQAVAGLFQHFCLRCVIYLVSSFTGNESVMVLITGMCIAKNGEDKITSGFLGSQLRKLQGLEISCVLLTQYCILYGLVPPLWEFCIDIGSDVPSKWCPILPRLILDLTLSETHLWHFHKWHPQLSPC